MLNQRSHRCAGNETLSKGVTFFYDESTKSGASLFSLPIGIHSPEDSLKFRIFFAFFDNGQIISERAKTWLELLVIQITCLVLVEVPGQRERNTPVRVRIVINLQVTRWMKWKMVYHRLITTSLPVNAMPGLNLGSYVESHCLNRFVFDCFARHQVEKNEFNHHRRKPEIWRLF